MDKIEVIYKEMSYDATNPHNTFVIAFCPDIDTFFVTNERDFFWETQQDFETKEDAIKYIKLNIEYFKNIHNQIMGECYAGNHYGRGKDIIFVECDNDTFYINGD